MNQVIDDRSADWFQFVMESIHRESSEGKSITEVVHEALLLDEKKRAKQESTI